MNHTPSSSLAPEFPAYLLDSYSDRERLYGQYELVRAEVHDGLERALALGGLPTAAATAEWRALDVGCGEGLFAADIVRRYPHVQVVGFDRDPEAILTAATVFGRPGSLDFYVHDVCQPLPAHFSAGSDTTSARDFDLVFANVVLMHIREVQRALTNLADALQPGGVIYTRDWDPVPLPFPHPSFQALSIAGVAALNRTACPDFTAQTPTYLADAGFTDITSSRHTYTIGGPTLAGQRMLHNLISGFQAARSALVEHLALLSAAEYDQHLQRLATEITPAMACAMVMVTTVARKPDR
ncbi:MAG: methyltransferase domain-containing protein [Chloroflexota bacterium]|nr:methyltransferase domain-containing protein [Chloroflexota bacterium]